MRSPAPSAKKKLGKIPLIISGFVTRIGVYDVPDGRPLIMLTVAKMSVDTIDDAIFPIREMKYEGAIA